MRFFLLLLAWAATVVVFWWTVWRVSRNWQSLGLGLARACLRSLAVSVAFAPTGVAAGLVGFPCLASIVIMASALGGWNAPEIRQNRDTALVLFFSFWLITFLIAAVRFLWIYDRRRAEAGA